MRPFLLEHVADHNNPDGSPYVVFERGLYNLNIIGIRTADNSANTFNDRLACVYRDESGWVTREWAITTDPGVYYRENPIGNNTGTAIMKCQQARGAYRLGKHRNLYTALVQVKPVLYWRDSNLDAVLDLTDEREGRIGLNIHRASRHGSEVVDRFSAGCQVFGDPDDYDAFIKLCEKSAELYGNGFTYTLISVGDD
jgi:hypothetical protein